MWSSTLVTEQLSPNSDPAVYIRYEEGEAVVIPVIPRPVDWHSAAFAKLQPCPKYAKPVTKWFDPDDAFVDITRTIRRVAKRLKERGL